MPPDGSVGRARDFAPCARPARALDLLALPGCQKNDQRHCRNHVFAALPQPWLARHFRKSFVISGIAANRLCRAALPQSWLARHCRKSFVFSGIAANRLCRAALPQIVCAERHCRNHGSRGIAAIINWLCLFAAMPHACSRSVSSRQCRT